MANHLTPEELSKEMGIKRDEVIRLCHEQAVPIYHGKIDKFLFSTVVQETSRLGLGRAQPTVLPRDDRTVA